MAELLAAADVVVMPSLQEGLGVAALEAMAAGCPLIVSRAGGLPEVVDQGAAGLIVEPGDAAALAAALRRVARDPVHARALAAAGRARVRRTFQHERHGRRDVRALSPAGRDGRWQHRAGFVTSYAASAARGCW